MQHPFQERLNRDDDDEPEKIRPSGPHPHPYHHCQGKTGEQDAGEGKPRNCRAASGRLRARRVRGHAVQATGAGQASGATLHLAHLGVDLGVGHLVPGTAGLPP